eukprot:5932759-Pyramimonas_sp.AAC.1
MQKLIQTQSQQMNDLMMQVSELSKKRDAPAESASASKKQRADGIEEGNDAATDNPTPIIIDDSPEEAGGASDDPDMKAAL